MARPLHYLNDPAVLQAERQAFVDAAFDLIVDAETVEVHVTEIVRRSGRHNAAFYRIFGSKEGLVLAVAEEAARRTAAALADHLAAAATPADAVRIWAEILLGRAATPTAAVATRPFALDRLRLLRGFPHAESTLDAPLRDLLRAALHAAGVPGPDLAAEAAYELVMSRQASWIALGHRPAAEEIAAYARLTQRLAGLEP